MDLDKEFVRAVVRGGKEAVMAAVDRDIDKEFDIGKGKEKGSYLVGEGKQAWEFIRAHFGKYDEVPSIQAIEVSLGIDLSGTMGESHAFFIDAIMKRRLWNLQRTGAKDVSDKLEAKDPVGAAEVWTEIHRKIQEEALTVRKVESLLSLGKQVIADYKDSKAGKRGIPTPWPSMDAMTLGWWPEDLVLFVGRLGIGKCIRALTPIQDPITGVHRTIEEVYNNPSLSMVTTWSKEKGIHAAPITAKIDTGHKECLKFKLGTGRTIEVTPEHPFLTPDGWKRADEIKPGGSVALPAIMPFPLEPKAMKDAEIDLLAILLADGSITEGHAGFTKDDPEIVRIASEAAAELGAEVVPHAAEYQYGIRCDAGARRNPVLDLTREHGISGKKSIEKTIPDAIFRLGREQLARFLSIFWMCDGYVSHGGPEIALASKKMLEQVQSLLLRFGIQSKLSDKPTRLDGKTFSAWRLMVYSAYQETFMNEFKLWGHRLENLEKMVALKKNPNVGFPKLSKDMCKGIEDLSRTFKIFCEIYGCEDKYKWLWDSGLFWDDVESIEDAGVQKIYDLTVDPTSCFIANDIIVHNTWSLVICAHKAWVTGHKTLVISTEMNKMQMARRFLALHLRLPYDEIRRGKLGEFVEDKFFKGVNELLSQDGIDIVAGDFDYSIDNISAVISDLKPKVMALDGAYLIKNSGKDRHEKVSNTFDDLKKMGKRYGHATITNLQFNRSAKTDQSSTISADNIGITDVAAWNADAAFGLSQTDDMRTGWRMGIKGMKVREGSPGEFELNWNHSSMDFSEIGGTATVDPIVASKKGGGSDGSFSNSFTGDPDPDDFDDVPF